MFQKGERTLVTAGITIKPIETEGRWNNKDVNWIACQCTTVECCEMYPYMCVFDALRLEALQDTKGVQRGTLVIRWHFVSNYCIDLQKRRQIRQAMTEGQIRLEDA